MRRDRAPVLGRLARALELRPVVALVTHAAVGREVQQRHARECHRPAVGHACDRPPLAGGGLLTGHAWPREPELGALLVRERPGRVLARIADLAERFRAVPGTVGVELADPLDVVRGPALRPAVDPALYRVHLHTGPSMSAQRVRALL